MANVDVCVTIFLILPTLSSRTGAQGDASFQAQCSTSSVEEQVAVLLWLCSHVLTREQLAEIYCQACASGAFLSMLLPCMASGGCTPSAGQASLAECCSQSICFSRGAGIVPRCLIACRFQQKAPSQHFYSCRQAKQVCTSSAEAEVENESEQTSEIRSCS